MCVCGVVCLTGGGGAVAIYSRCCVVHVFMLFAEYVSAVSYSSKSVIIC